MSLTVCPYDGITYTIKNSCFRTVIRFSGETYPGVIRTAALAGAAWLAGLPYA